MALWEVLLLRRYERQFLVFWVGQVRGFRLDNRLTQEKLAEALHLTARSYQKLEQGVHLPCATTLALFLGQLTDQEVLAFVRTFAQLVETARFQEAPDAHEITQLPGESRRARALGGP